VQQQALRDFAIAVDNFYRGTHGRPRWRKKGLDEGFCIRDVTVVRLNGRWATVFVPKCGPIRFRQSRSLPASYGMARVTLDRAGRWHVSFTAPQPILRRQPTSQTVGLDAGVAATLTTSAGEHLHTPGLRIAEGQRLRRLQRRFSRQQKGSKRRERTKTSIAKLKARETDRRRDFIEQVTTRLVRGHDMIAIEDLAVKKMVASSKGGVDQPGRNVAQKRGLNRSIHAQGWAMIRRRLEDKAATCGVVVVAVDPAGTSQRCAICGYTASNNRESQAVFRCRSCGHHANADVNAARNILAAGLAVTARGGTPHQGPSETRTRPGPLAA
jgi:IS605 OrfB family transposase